MSVLFSQRRHLQRSISRLDVVKSEGFLQTLRQEVSHFNSQTLSVCKNVFIAAGQPYERYGKVFGRVKCPTNQIGYNCGWFR